MATKMTTEMTRELTKQKATVIASKKDPQIMRPSACAQILLKKNIVLPFRYLI